MSKKYSTGERRNHADQQSRRQLVRRLRERQDRVLPNQLRAGDCTASQHVSGRQYNFVQCTLTRFGCCWLNDVTSYFTDCSHNWSLLFIPLRVVLDEIRPESYTYKNILFTILMYRNRTVIFY